jgi:hypothetical protein
MKHLKSFKIFENDNFKKGSYLDDDHLDTERSANSSLPKSENDNFKKGSYLDDDHLDTERSANSALPKSVTDALADVVSNLSSKDIATLRKQLIGVTPDKIEDAVEKAQDEAQSAPEAKNESWLGRNKGTIGATLFIGGLAALGIRGEQLSHITDVLKDAQIYGDFFKDPALVSAGISTLLGLVGISTAVKQGFDKAAVDAKINWENNMIKKGLAKKDANGVLISLKTGKPLVYAR